MVYAVFSVSDMKVCMPGFRAADLEGAGWGREERVAPGDVGEVGELAV
jgi:hypothetical protein